MKNRFTTLLVCLLCLCTLPAQANFAGTPTLKKLTAQADVVVKATALETQPVEDAEMMQLLGSTISSTRFEIVSVIKGTVAEKTIEFHHYSGVAKPMIFPFSGPSPSTFVVGRTYLLWADAALNGSYRQTRAAESFYYLAVMLAGDAMPITDVTADITEIVWHELTTLLPSKNPQDTIAAITRLVQLSDKKSFGGPTKDFEGTRIARALAPYFTAPDEKVAYVAIKAVDGPGAKEVQTELIAVANSTAVPARRAAALQSLMGIRTPEARTTALAHATSIEPSVRAAALILLADFPDAQARNLWKISARSRDENVRIGAANAIGTARDGSMAATLNRLVDDADSGVREAAVRALLILPPASARPYWEKRRTQTDFWPLFINALAAGDAAPYRDELARIVRTSAHPRSNVALGGQNAVYTAWHLLFEDLRKQPREVQLAPKTQVLWDALENSGNWSSSEPEQLYEWLRRIGLEKRAQGYRQRIEAKQTYMLYSFRNADEAILRGPQWNHRTR